ncbi:Peroxiredoxin [invertebrate metagenome]|uniref:Peroxiredoxin n=1 Tax=invertebrate metagenome TaxID=1711999 RepID=A0A2H9T9H5_9ZZZZ
MCTTELAAIIPLQAEMKQRGIPVRFIGLRVDSIAQHRSRIKDIEDYAKDVLKHSGKVTYPMIGDLSLKIAKLFGMLPYDAGDSSEERSAADNMTVRSLFIIGPDKKVRLKLPQPMTIS